MTHTHAFDKISEDKPCPLFLEAALQDAGEALGGPVSLNQKEVV